VPIVGLRLCDLCGGAATRSAGSVGTAGPAETGLGTQIERPL